MSVRGRGSRSRQTRNEVLRELNRSVSRSPEEAPESQVDKIKRKNDDSIALRRKKSRTQENMNTDLDSARRSFANTINSHVSVSSITIQPASSIAISSSCTSSASICSTTTNSTFSASNPCTSNAISMPCNQAAKLGSNFSDDLMPDEILSHMISEMNEG